jgi:probable UDP-sugar transporter A4
MTSENDLSTDSMKTSTPSSLETPSSSKERSDDVIHRSAFRAMIFFQVCAYGSYSVLIHLCERDGAIMFSSATMNLVLELVKLVFSIGALFWSSTKTLSLVPTQESWFRHSLPYAIPGLLYFINNNLAVHMQLQMDPASYQILSNFKIATTAILYRLIIKHKLSRRQWFAVTLLFFGGLFYSLGIVICICS